MRATRSHRALAVGMVTLASLAACVPAPAQPESRERGESFLPVVALVNTSAPDDG